MKGKEAKDYRKTDAVWSEIGVLLIVCSERDLWFQY